MEAAKGPTIITDKEEMRKWSRKKKSQGKTLALVPTMGFLHQGHLSLVKEAQTCAQIVVVSIYLNPGQFSPAEDLSTYPSDFDGDVRKLTALDGGVHAVFHPQNLYDYKNERSGGETAGRDAGKVVSCVEDGSGHETWVRVEKLEKGLCGASRPIFFRGVATIVSKLFNIVEPDVAVFGKKDYQQWKIIQRMVRDLDFPVEIVGAEIVRESDGLAMSSRNVRLSEEERKKALSIRRSLLEARTAAESGRREADGLKKMVRDGIEKAGGRVDYAEIVEQEELLTVQEICAPVVLCVAALFGNVRLIDNIEINTPASACQ